MRMRVELKINGKWVDISSEVTIGKVEPLRPNRNLVVVGEHGPELAIGVTPPQTFTNITLGSQGIRKRKDDDDGSAMAAV